MLSTFRSTSCSRGNPPCACPASAARLPISNSSSMLSPVCPRPSRRLSPSFSIPSSSKPRWRRSTPQADAGTDHPRKRPQRLSQPLRRGAGSTAAPSGTAHRRAPWRSLLAALHTDRTAAALPLQPHPSPLPACSRVQRQPIDPPRKHPIRAQTAARCSALRTNPTTCYKTQISLQQTTASRCTVCLQYRDCTDSPCPAQHQATKPCYGLPDGTRRAMHTISQR